MDSRGGAHGAHGTAAEFEQSQGGVEKSRFSPSRIEEFKQLAADPRVYEKVRPYGTRSVRPHPRRGSST